jgi:hypothetical protein
MSNVAQGFFITKPDNNTPQEFIQLVNDAIGYIMDGSGNKRGPLLSETIEAAHAKEPPAIVAGPHQLWRVTCERISEGDGNA